MYHDPAKFSPVSGVTKKLLNESTRGGHLINFVFGLLLLNTVYFDLDL